MNGFLTVKRSQGKMLSARFSPGPPGEKARLAAFGPTLAPCRVLSAELPLCPTEPPVRLKRPVFFAVLGTTDNISRIFRRNLCENWDKSSHFIRKFCLIGNFDHLTFAQKLGRLGNCSRSFARYLSCGSTDFQSLIVGASFVNVSMYCIAVG